MVKKIKINDKINIKRNRKEKKNFMTSLSNNERDTVRVLKGPQFHYFDKESQKDFFSKNYKISNLTDRMGMRLEGNIMKNIVSTNIRSEGITKGAIQVPIDESLSITFEDKTIIDPKKKSELFGQYDHVRKYGKDYYDRLKSVGFKVKKIDVQKTLSEKEIKEYCLPKYEKIPFVIKS